MIEKAQNKTNYLTSTALFAALLPTPYAVLAGAIGGAMADLLSAPIWAIPTFSIKMFIALPFTSSGKRNYIHPTRNHTRQNALQTLMRRQKVQTAHAGEN